MICPKCGGKNFKTIDTSEGIELDFCQDCFGILFDAQEVAENFELERDIPDIALVKGEARWTDYSCPKCRGRWVELPYAIGNDLLVDLCTGCGAIWLDKGEYAKLERIAAGLDRPSSKVMRAIKTLEGRGYQILGIRK